jgi:hypothetical protein
MLSFTLLKEETENLVNHLKSAGKVVAGLGTLGVGGAAGYKIGKIVGANKVLEKKYNINDQQNNGQI